MSGVAFIIFVNTRPKTIRSFINPFSVSNKQKLKKKGVEKRRPFKNQHFWHTFCHEKKLRRKYILFTYYKWDLKHVKCRRKVSNFMQRISLETRYVKFIHTRYELRAILSKWLTSTGIWKNRTAQGLEGGVFRAKYVTISEKVFSEKDVFFLCRLRSEQIWDKGVFFTHFGVVTHLSMIISHVMNEIPSKHTKKTQSLKKIWRYFD